MSPKKTKVLVTVALTLLLVLGVVGTVLAISYDAMLIGVTDGQPIYGKISGHDPDEYWAGVFEMYVYGEGKKPGFCTDMDHTTSKWQKYSISDETTTCEILYIFENYPPQLYGLGDLEAAARQVAIWSYSDDFEIVSPNDVASRAQEIIDEVDDLVDPCAELGLLTLSIEHLGGNVYQVVTSLPTEVLTIAIYADGKLLVGSPFPTVDGKVNFTVPDGTTHIEAKTSYEQPTVTILVGYPPGVEVQKVLLPHGSQVEITAEYEVPTAIKLASFTAVPGVGGVTLAWETGTEVDNAGFNLYRAIAEDGSYTKINDALIATEGDPVAGASYSFLDKGLPDGIYYYKLEDVDYYGVTTLHGPVSATVLPRLRRPAFRPSAPGF